MSALNEQAQFKKSTNAVHCGRFLLIEWTGMSRDQKKQQTRELILKTAEQLFQSEGYDKVSTRMIAQACGVANGTVFAHFKDKPALTRALFHARIEARLAEQANQLAEQTSGLKTFLTMASFFYKVYDEDRAFSVALMQNALFDLSYFESQMSDFIAQVAAKLKGDLADKTEAQCTAVAKAWFGYYVFHLFAGLSTEHSTPETWLAGLTQDCETLLSTIG